MARERLSRNSPCPCGSGTKYKHCCHNKGFEWVADDDGTVYQSTPLSPEAVEILREQRERFVARFGREPRPDEPIFFDAPPVEQIEFQMVQAMKAAGIDPAVIYAYEKTDGLLVTESNQHLIPDKDLAAWQAAIDEYEAKHRGKPEQP
ncbi:MAG TPA: SEC-C domain-containing protein [Urbifossiella sp.]|nr:SEC-C domain-containing protein [Urbifossiella sp.]